MKKEYLFSKVLCAKTLPRIGTRKSLDDQGELRVLPGQLNFVGKKTQLTIHLIVRISALRDVIPWKFIIFTNFCAIVILVTWHVITLTQIFIFNFCFLILLKWEHRWACIVYINDLGKTEEIFFSDVSQIWIGVKPAKKILDAVTEQFGIETNA